MRLYLDQMFPADFAVLLREHGYDVIRASDVGQARADDADILARASRLRRTLITLDKHFGDWVVLPLNHHAGVIRVKVHPPLVSNIVPVLLPFLASHQQEQFANHLIILSATSTRWIHTVDH